jgi:CRP-like cAMP-binding protein
MVAAHPIEMPATPLFAGLEQDDWPELLKHSTRMELLTTEPVFKQGGPADAFFVVLQGTVEVRAKTAAGPERPLAHLGQGAVIGETSLLLGGQHSASVYAAEPSTILMFPKEAFLQMIQERQSGAVRVLYNIAHTLSVRLRAADAHIAELSMSQTVQTGANGTIIGRDAERLRNLFLTEWV